MFEKERREKGESWKEEGTKERGKRKNEQKIE